MKLRIITENDEYSGLEDADQFRPSRPDFLPRDKVLSDVVRDLTILTKETDELQTNWSPQRAASIVRVLRSSATLLNMLVEADVE